MTGIGLVYLVEVTLAHLLGLREYGLYSYGVTCASVLAIPATLGLGTGVLRYIGEYTSKGRTDLLKGLVLRSWQLVIGVGSTLVIVALLVLWALRLGAPDALSTAVALGLLLVPLKGLQEIQRSMGRGLGRVLLAYLPGRIVQPVLLVVLLLAVDLLIGSPSASTALLLTLLAVGVTCAGQSGLIVRHVFRSAETGKPSYRTREWLRVSLPMVLISGFMLLLSRTDVLLLGMLRTPNDVGMYNAATRTAGLVTLGLSSASAIGASRIGNLYAAGDREGLQQLASRLVQLAFWPGLIVVLLLLLFAPSILSLFGHGFERAHLALDVLAFGNLFAVSVGPVGYYMSMTGNQDLLAFVVGISVVINILLNLALIPPLGLLGSAIATALSSGLWNLWLSAVVRRRLGVKTSLAGSLAEALSR